MTIDEFVCCDGQVHFLYQFSLQFFLDIFAAVLYSNPSLESVKEYDKRLAIITSDLFNVSIFANMKQIYFLRWLQRYI